ncbi:dephospho-CoA kinase [Arthrobacter sp. TWP1-1]|uniref:dephospho-CoA kinase n=1 Tax=Arthrobacter sp. TWP1-1 TaxID=2804568 RepID=UPI003CF816DE
MLSLGLTGGIAAGKSLLANRFRELGAIVIDADRLARDVVALGTPGLAAVVERFGRDILLPDGTLDRPQLGALVFSDDTARQALNAIVHPLVRAAADSLKLDAGPSTIVVQDIPLLVESGQGANFHLVVVVQAPRDERIARMVRDRGMSEADAVARMAAQASDEERAAAADVVILNDGSPEHAVAELDTLWHGRLLPFAANLAATKAAAHPGVAAASGLVGAAGAIRLGQRIRRALGDLATCVERANSDAGSLVYELSSASEIGPDRIVSALAAAGFFPRVGAGGNVLASADQAISATVVILPS